MFPYPNDLTALAPIGACLIDSSVNANCYQLYICADPCDPNQPSHLQMTGGTLTSRTYSYDWLGIAIGFVTGGSGSMTLTNGTVNVTNYDGEGGNLNIGGYETGVGTLTMLGGTITCYHLDCTDWATSEGHFNLYGGTFYTTADEDWTEFWMGMPGESPNSTIDVTDGKAIITSHNENELDWINLWIVEGKITAFGGAAPRAELYVDYNITNPGKTTLQAISTELEQAWRPNPRPGKTVNYIPTLTWTPGDGAVSHVVYFSTDRDAVENGTAPNTPRDVNNLYAGVYAFSADFYWRVDEVNTSGTTEGLVWSYKTDDHRAVDDFEVYATSDDLGNVWNDAWTIPALKAYVYLETGATNPALVHDGYSMKYDYKNTATGGTATYRYSEAWANTADLKKIDQNFTLSGAEALVLYFYGQPLNSADPVRDRMWVALSSDGITKGVVPYDGDMNDIKEALWHEWNIDLADPCLAGVVMTSVDTVHIGFGDRNKTKTNGGSGTVYFDDIGVYPRRCLTEFVPADLTGDCIAGYEELDILAGDWLKSGYDVNAVPPSKAPICRYKLDEGAGLTTANSGSYGASYNASLSGAAGGPTDDLTWVKPGAPHPNRGDPNYAIGFDGKTAEWIIADANLNDHAGGFTTNTMTITCWVKRAGDQYSWTGLVFATRDTGDWEGSIVHAGLSFGDDADWELAGKIQPSSINHLAYHWENNPDVNDATPDGEDEIWWWRSGLEVPDGEWTFCAVVVEPEQASLYMMPAGEALSKAVNIETHIPSTIVNPFYIGKDARGDWGGNRTLTGQIDDGQIFDYALSDSEVLYVANPGGSTHIPVMSRVDFDDSDSIDFRDYAVVADKWLEEILWP